MAKFPHFPPTSPKVLAAGGASATTLYVYRLLDQVSWIHDLNGDLKWGAALLASGAVTALAGWLKRDSHQIEQKS